MGIIVLQAAMEEELLPVVAHLDDAEELQIPGLKRAVAGIHQGQRIVALQSGIGLVHASHAATLACTALEQTPVAILSVGTAGAIPPHAQIGDVVAAGVATPGDVNLTPFGYERGQVPGQPAHYQADPQLLALAQPLVDKVGEFVCVDSFVGEEEAARLQGFFPQAGIVDMETSAIAQVARMHEVPFLSVRSVTDMCSAQQHEQEVDRSAASSAQVALQIAVSFGAA